MKDFTEKSPKCCKIIKFFQIFQEISLSQMLCRIFQQRIAVYLAIKLLKFMLSFTKTNVIFTNSTFDGKH